MTFNLIAFLSTWYSGTKTKRKVLPHWVPNGASIIVAQSSVSMCYFSDRHSLSHNNHHWNTLYYIGVHRQVQKQPMSYQRRSRFALKTVYIALMSILEYIYKFTIINWLRKHDCQTVFAESRKKENVFELLGGHPH